MIQTTTAELKTAQDEVVALKTELQSTMRELETGREELNLLKENGQKSVNVTVLDIVSSGTKTNTRELSHLKSSIQTTARNGTEVTMKSLLSKIEREVELMKVTTNSSIGQLKTRVCYGVQLEHPMSSVPWGRPIKFDTVTVNDGSDYNSTTGKFVTRVPGSYFFWAQVVLVTTSADIDLVLKVNGAVVAGGMVHTGQIEFDTAVIAYITDLKTGDQVWLEKRSGKGHYLRGALYSGYGGVLLSHT